MNHSIKSVVPGSKFNRLTVLRRVGCDKHGTAMFDCVCECGKQRNVRGKNLVSGNTMSCGCYNKQVISGHKRERIIPDIKKCNACFEEKPIDDFELRRDYGYHRDICKKCQKKNSDNWRLKNRDTVLAKKRQWNLDNREKIKARRKKVLLESPEKVYTDSYYAKKDEYRQNNRSACNARIRNWKSRNQHKLNAYGRKRKSMKNNAAPRWANQEIIFSIYENARKLSAETGIPHHVDHIVPLVDRKSRVCGLHCEQNLRVITKQENLEKNSHRWPDMPEVTHG